MRRRVASIEEFGERNGGIGVFGAEFLGLLHPVSGTAPGLTLAGIEDPDVGDSEIEIVLDPLAHLGEPVILGEDLDGSILGTAPSRSRLGLECRVFADAYRAATVRERLSSPVQLRTRERVGLHLQM